MEQLQHFFRERGVRLTEPRREIYRLLNEHEQPLTIAELLKMSRIAERTSVYRTLELFSKIGLVEAVQIKGKIRYELAEPFKPHHHHIVCTSCGALVPLDSGRLEKVIRHLADSSRYELTSHHVELQGRCQNCVKTTTPT